MPSPKRSAPASASSMNTLLFGLMYGFTPGARRWSGTGTSGPALVRSSISAHGVVAPLAVTETVTDCASTGARDSAMVWSGSPVPAGSSSPTTCARCSTGTELMPIQRNCAWVAADGWMRSQVMMRSLNAASSRDGGSWSTPASSGSRLFQRVSWSLPGRVTSITPGSVNTSLVWLESVSYTHLTLQTNREV